ncbi:MAG TPA: lytic transglycosylase domain-containing protein [Chitinophagaceae bacterium]|nr:lytic transglycosylase domain-containing protein [Chitinophagaceae bacterium]
MLSRQVWKMSFFCQAFFLVIAGTKGRNIRHPESDTLIAKRDSFVTPRIPLNSHAVRFVEGFLKENSEDLEMARERSRSCFTLMDSILTSYGLPAELKYLAVVESNLDRNAVSPVGAAGPWQLMPSTARLLGLRVTPRYDERKFYGKSTVAAARYLKDLYDQFGDWLLTIAAYNGGPAPVYRAIRLSGSRNFWKLQSYLPMETRGHVKRYIGTHYFFEGQGSITTLTQTEFLNHLKQVNSLRKQFDQERAADSLPVAAVTQPGADQSGRLYAALMMRPRLK